MKFIVDDRAVVRIPASDQKYFECEQNSSHPTIGEVKFKALLISSNFFFIDG